jgi:hypothetical protein
MLKVMLSVVMLNNWVNSWELSNLVKKEKKGEKEKK